MEILQDIGNKIGFDWRLALTHTINLLVIFFLLVKFALPGIKKTMDDRKKKIEEGLKMREEADAIKANAQMEAKGIAIEANKKAQEVVSRADVSAKLIAQEASDKANSTIQEANKIKETAKDAGLKEAENIINRDISKILSKIGANAFSGKLTPEVNGEFISKVFADNK